MKKKHILNNLLIGTALLFASSCQETDEMPTSVEPTIPEGLIGTPIQFDTNIATSEAGATRATEIIEAGTTMTVGMKVNGSTIYVDYIYNGTSWKVAEGNEPLRWQDQVDHSFIAVSPARNMNDLTITIPSAFTEADVAACDKLLTTTAVLTTKPATGINLALKHPLVKIVIRTKNTNEVKLKGQTLSTTIDPNTGNLVAVNHKEATGEISMYQSGISFTAYILPRTAEEQLKFYSYKEQNFPANTEMPSGSNFSCTEADRVE